MDSPLRGLVGTWRGTGRGEFPTMDAFHYEEEVSFDELGVPAIVYRQRAWSPASREVLHVETGIWRVGTDGSLTVSIALPRLTEISEGSIAGGHIELAATSVSRAAGGAPLLSVRRHYDVSDGVIAYRIAMATERVSALTGHLVGELRRAPS